jgi:pyridinium-3,5-bisthiocarboxylic acid mononucleotide nickel chelatase
MQTGKHLYLDCTSGIAGDMFLGAAIDLGVPEAVIREGLGKLPLHGYRLEVGRKRHSGISGCDVKVVVEHEHGHGHDHGHREWAEIRGLIEGAPLAESAKQRALDIFSRVARAESRLHDVPLEKVAFHEVGAVDSIVDIVGAALALDHMRPARVSSRPVPLGHGFCRCAHGVLPVPSPAAVAILAEVGAAVEDGGLDIELCTPTGAAIVASCATEFGPIPAAPVLGAGYGAGDTELPDRPNHLRLLLFEPQAADAAERDAVVIEANIDDMPSEFCGYLLERLFAAGARDVWFTPIVMKKGRPALTVSALCAAELREAVGAALLTESTSIGYRYRAVGRRTLSRSSVEVPTPFGPVTVKVASDGERVLNAAPEFEVVRRLAEAAEVSWKEVYAAALAGYRGLAESGSPRR